MAQQRPPSAEPDEFPSGDPWLAFGYLVSGVLLYGLIGWLLDRWLGTSFLVVVGILLGVTLGLLMTWWRFRAPVANHSQIHETRSDPDQSDDNQHHQT